MIFNPNVDLNHRVAGMLSSLGVQALDEITVEMMRNYTLESDPAHRLYLTLGYNKTLQRYVINQLSRYTSTNMPIFPDKYDLDLELFISSLPVRLINSIYSNALVMDDFVDNPSTAAPDRILLKFIHGLLADARESLNLWTVMKDHDLPLYVPLVPLILFLLYANELVGVGETLEAKTFIFETGTTSASTQVTLDWEGDIQHTPSAYAYTAAQLTNFVKSRDTLLGNINLSNVQSKLPAMHEFNLGSNDSELRSVIGASRESVQWIGLRIPNIAACSPVPINGRFSNLPGHHVNMNLDHDGSVATASNSYFRGFVHLNWVKGIPMTVYATINVPNLNSPVVLTESDIATLLYGFGNIRLSSRIYDSVEMPQPTINVSIPSIKLLLSTSGTSINQLSNTGLLKSTPISNTGLHAKTYKCEASINTNTAGVSLKSVDVRIDVEDQALISDNVIYGVIASYANSIFNGVTSDYELPSIIELSSNGVKSANKISSYIGTNYSAHELFLMSVKRMEKTVDVNVSLFAWLRSSGKSKVKTDDYLDPGDILDSAIPLRSINTIYNDNTTKSSEVSATNQAAFTSVLDKTQITSWNELIQVMALIEDQDLPIDPATNLPTFKPLTLPSGVTLTPTECESLVTVVDSAILPQLADNLNNNIPKLVNMRVLSSGILNGLDSNRVTEVYTGAVSESFATVKSQLSAIPGLNLIFDKIADESGRYVNSFKRFLSVKGTGQLVNSIKSDSQVMEQYTGVINQSKLITDFVDTDLMNLMEFRQYSKVSDVFGKPSELEPFIATESKVIGMNNLSDLYPYQNGLSLLVDNVIDASVKAGSKALAWLGEAMITGVVAGYEVIKVMLHFIGNAITTGITAIRSVFMDGLSFKEYPNGILPIFEYPMLTGSVRTPTAFWKSRDLMGSLNYLSIPLTSSCRLFLIPDTVSGDLVHYQLYAGANKNRVRYSDYLVSISSVLGEAIGNTYISDFRDKVTFPDSYFQYNDKVRLTITIPLKDVATSMGITREGFPGRIVSIKFLTTSLTASNVKCTMVGSDIVSRELSTKLVSPSVVQIDLSSNETSVFSGETLILTIDYTRDYAKLPEDYHTISAIELSDMNGDSNFLSSDRDFVENILFSANAAIAVMNALGSLSLGDNQLDFNFNLDFDSLTKYTEIINALKDDSDYKRQALAQQGDNYAGILLATTMMGATIGTFVPIPGLSTAIGTAVGAGVGLIVVASMEFDSSKHKAIEKEIARRIDNIITSGHAYNLLNDIMSANLESQLIYKSGELAPLFSGGASELAQLAIAVAINSGMLLQFSEQLSYSNINDGLTRIVLPTFQSMPKPLYGIVTGSELLESAKRVTTIIGYTLLAVAAATLTIKFSSTLSNILFSQIKKRYGWWRDENWTREILGDELSQLARTSDITSAVASGALSLGLLAIVKDIARLRGLSESDVLAMVTENLLFGSRSLNKSF